MHKQECSPLQHARRHSRAALLQVSDGFLPLNLDFFTPSLKFIVKLAFEVKA
jgi:hypothetical protein